MKIDEHFNLSIMVKKRYVFFLIWLNNSIASNTTFQEIDYDTFENVTLKATHMICAFSWQPLIFIQTVCSIAIFSIFRKILSMIKFENK